MTARTDMLRTRRDLARAGVTEPTLSRLAPDPYAVRPDAEPFEQGTEDLFQAQAERWLRDRGYCQQWPKDILVGRPERGYQFHMRRPADNQVAPDLWLFGHDGRYLALELKTAKGRLNPHQRAWAEHGFIEVCRTMGELKRAVEQWERGQREGPTDV